MLTLAHPWLFLLLPLPLAVLLLLPEYRDSRDALRVPFLEKLGRLSGQKPVEGAVVVRRQWFRLGVLWSVWFCVVLALARPQRVEAPLTKTIPVRDLLLAVDLSGSMETKDFTNRQGKTVDRLTAVKQVLDEFLARQTGSRVGLIVFGNAPFVQAPFTQDLEVCKELLAETEPRMAGPKTALGDAIGLAITVFERSDAPERTLIVLTDGNDTGSEVPPQKAAEVARDKQITIHTVAVGDPKAAGEEALDEKTLAAVAQTTGGVYAHANNQQELSKFYERVDQLKTHQAKTITSHPKTDLFHWPLGVGLILSMVPFCLGGGGTVE
ncbi:MAG TPA: VWA domain-containing protein [Planctomicrobium sp.]|nr:VWA domain-containing protein [Planctomicrobium sp.]